MTPLFSQVTSNAIEKEINHYFTASLDDAKEISDSYVRLWTSLHELITSGGKRFRPNITMLSYEIFGGETPATVIPIAAAQELLHLSLLVHDDIIDRDDMRYGVSNITGRYKTFYQPYLKDAHELTHFSQSAAILAGDLLLAGAHALITKSNATAVQKQVAHNLIAKSIFDVAGGELLDTEMSFLPYTPGDALKVALYKTARYSFVIPLLTGAKLATITSKQESHLQEYAEALGTAYQLVDDLLGVFGNEKTTGKSTQSDIREGKRTFLIEQAISQMNATDLQLFNNTFGNLHASSQSIDTVKNLLRSVSAKQKTEAEIDRLKIIALNAAAKLQLASHLEAKLHTLVHITTERQA